MMKSSIVSGLKQVSNSKNATSEKTWISLIWMTKALDAKLLLIQIAQVYNRQNVELILAKN